MSDAEFLHTVTPAESDALEEVRGLVVPLRAFRGFLLEHPRVALSLLELISRRLREAEARRAGS